jgi:hypothetical protein
LNNKLRTFSLFCFFMGQYCPIFTRILHDYLYLNNKLRTFSLFRFFISHFTNTYGFSFEKTDNIFANCIFVRIREIFKTNRETWRSARKPGDSRVNRETWQLCNYQLPFTLKRRSSPCIFQVVVSLSIRSFPMNVTIYTDTDRSRLCNSGKC